MCIRDRKCACAWFLLEIGFVRFIPCLPAPLGNPCAEPVRRRCMPEVRLFQTGNTTEKASECEVRHNGTAARYAAHVIGLVSRCRSPKPCLLYTSDAADDLTRVDLGGRRLIKKKKKKNKKN